MGSLGPRSMMAIAAVFAIEGLVLAQQAWVASPQLRVPHGVAYVVAAAALFGALMIALQAAGIDRWNDALAAGFLIGSTIELLWFTFGSGPRHCTIGGWRPPEPVCRTGLAMVTVICVGMSAWAVRRALR